VRFVPACAASLVSGAGALEEPAWPPTTLHRLGDQRSDLAWRGHGDRGQLIVTAMLDPVAPSSGRRPSGPGRADQDHDDAEGGEPVSDPVAKAAREVEQAREQVEEKVGELAERAPAEARLLAKRIVFAVVSAIVLLVVRKLIDKVWERVTGELPPTKLHREEA
jgi:hypothetical protein